MHAHPDEAVVGYEKACTMQSVAKAVECGGQGQDADLVLLLRFKHFLLHHDWIQPTTSSQIQQDINAYSLSNPTMTSDEGADMGQW